MVSFAKKAKWDSQINHGSLVGGMPNLAPDVAVWPTQSLNYLSSLMKEKENSPYAGSWRWLFSCSCGVNLEPGKFEELSLSLHILYWMGIWRKFDQSSNLSWPQAQSPLHFCTMGTWPEGTLYPSQVVVGPAAPPLQRGPPPRSTWCATLNHKRFHPTRHSMKVQIKYKP